MSQALAPGWTEAFTRAVSSPDEATRAEALGMRPRKCLRTPESRTLLSRQNGNRQSQLTRSAQRHLPPIDEEEP